MTRRSHPPHRRSATSPDVHHARQAVRSLAGYEKVHLEAGQCRTVTITVEEREPEHRDTDAHALALGTGPRAVGGLLVPDAAAAHPIDVTTGRTS